MNGLFKYISPFAPDQSGATAVLFSLGGIVVICDAGGCAGNICGFDEPRWFTEKSAVFSAGLRDIDAILGRDERLVQKLEEAVRFIDAKFAAIIGTPVPAVIGTDFRALRRMAEARLGITVLALDTTGIGLYDEGEEKAYIALLSAFARENFCRRFEVGVFGATPLNMPYKGYEKQLKAEFERRYGTVSLFTGEDGIEDFRNAGGAKLNIAVSTSGIKACEYLKQRFGTEYRVEFPVERQEAITNDQIPITNCGGASRSFCGVQGAKCEGFSITNDELRMTNDELRMTNDELRMTNDELRITNNERRTTNDERRTTGEAKYERPAKCEYPTLIMHQQVLANSIRAALETKGQTADVATWFKLNKNYSREGDVRLTEEDGLFALLAGRKYSRIIADPIFKRCLADFDGEFIPICHYSCSGELFAAEAELDWENIVDRLKERNIETA